jgi:hydrogenase nickel incorporation protein HypA/HybF
MEQGGPVVGLLGDPGVTLHELPITQSLLEIVLEHASRAEADRVTDVHLVVGDLSGISRECVEFYWEIVSRDTPAEGARLHFRRVPLQFECRDCGVVFERRGEEFECPSCGAKRVRVAAGDDCRLEAIDV